MLKAYFIELSAYNSWANYKAMDWLSQIDDEQWERANVSSFCSVRNTAVHLASAEKIWIDFWTSVKDPVYLSAEFAGTKDELINIWSAASKGLKNLSKGILKKNT